MSVSGQRFVRVAERQKARGEPGNRRADRAGSETD